MNTLKKIMVLLTMLFLSWAASAQTQTFGGRVRIGVTPEAPTIDSLLVIGSDKLVKHVRYTDLYNKIFGEFGGLFGNVAYTDVANVFSLQQTINSGTTDKVLQLTSTDPSSVISFADVNTTVNPLLGGVGNQLRFYTNNLERIRIEENGDIDFKLGITTFGKTIKSNNNIELGGLGGNRYLQLYNDDLKSNKIYTTHNTINAELTIQGVNYTHSVNFRDSYGVNPPVYAKIQGGYINDARLTLRTHNSSQVKTKESIYASNEAIIDGNLEVKGSIYGKDTDWTKYEIAKGGYDHRFFTRTNTGAALERLKITGGAVNGSVNILNADLNVSGKIYSNDDIIQSGAHVIKNSDDHLYLQTDALDKNIYFRTRGNNTRYQINHDGNHDFKTGTASFRGNINSYSSFRAISSNMYLNSDYFLHFDLNVSNDYAIWKSGSILNFKSFGGFYFNNSITAPNFIGKWNGETKSQLLNNVVKTSTINTFDEINVFEDQVQINDFITISDGYLTNTTALINSASNTTLVNRRWVEDQGYLTTHQSLSNYANLSSNNTFNGTNTFGNPVYFTADVEIDSNLEMNGNDISGVLAMEANEFIKAGGTASQILMANGSVSTKITNNNQLTNGAGYITTDTNTQLTEAQVDAYVANNGYMSVGADTNWTNATMSNVSSGVLEYKKKHGRLIVKGQVTPSSTNSSLIIATLPVGFRPDYNRFKVSVKNPTGTPSVVSCWVSAGGEVRLDAISGSIYSIDLDFTLDTSN